HCACTLVPRFVAFSFEATMGAQPVAVETVAVAGSARRTVPASLPSVPNPSSGAPWTTKRPGGQMGGTAASATPFAATSADVRNRWSAERIMHLPPGRPCVTGEAYQGRVARVKI